MAECFLSDLQELEASDDEGAETSAGVAGSLAGGVSGGAGSTKDAASGIAEEYDLLPIVDAVAEFLLRQSGARPEAVVTDLAESEKYKSLLSVSRASEPEQPAESFLSSEKLDSLLRLTRSA